MQDEVPEATLRQVLATTRGEFTVASDVTALLGMAPFLYVEAMTLFEYGAWGWFSVWNVLDVVAYANQVGPKCFPFFPCTFLSLCGLSHVPLTSLSICPSLSLPLALCFPLHLPVCPVPQRCLAPLSLRRFLLSPLMQTLCLHFLFVKHPRPPNAIKPVRPSCPPGAP
jgi:hypothetical protein